MTDAVQLARLLEERGTAIAMELVDAPEGIVCLSGETAAQPRVPLSLIAEGEDAAFDSDTVEAVTAALPTFLAEAVVAVIESGLVPRDAADADPHGWAPELSFFGEDAWAIRFASPPVPSELGLLVDFEGRAIVSVLDLDADEDVEDEGDAHLDSGSDTPLDPTQP